MINLLILASSLIALLLVLKINKDAIVAIALPIGLAAPPDARLNNGGRIGFGSRIRSVSFDGLFCNLLALADYMEDYLIVRSAEISHRFSALLAPARTAAMTGFVTRNLRSQSGMTMRRQRSIFADAATRIASTLEQIETQVFPTGVSSGSVRPAF